MEGVEFFNGFILDVYLWICFERMFRAWTMEKTNDLYA